MLFNFSAHGPDTNTINPSQLEGNAFSRHMERNMPTTRSYYKSGTPRRGCQRTCRTGTRKVTTFTKNSPAFKNVRDECQWRMGSYRTVWSQFTGAGQRTPFSPTNANRWLRYVNSGYRVYKWTPKDFYRYFGQQWQQQTPTSCYRWMRRKYGACIKDITRGAGNCWLVATSPSVTGYPFQSYRWK